MALECVYRDVGRLFMMSVRAHVHSPSVKDRSAALRRWLLPTGSNLEGFVSPAPPTSPIDKPKNETQCAWEQAATLFPARRLDKGPKSDDNPPQGRSPANIALALRLGGPMTRPV